MTLVSSNPALFARSNKKLLEELPSVKRNTTNKYNFRRPSSADKFFQKCSLVFKLRDSFFSFTNTNMNKASTVGITEIAKIFL